MTNLKSFMRLVRLSALAAGFAVGGSAISAQSESPELLNKAHRAVASIGRSEGHIEATGLFLSELEKALELGRSHDLTMPLMATYFSFVGRHADSRLALPQDELAVEAQLSSHEAIDAIPYVVKAASTSNIIIINEAHNAPLHRGFTRELLAPLRVRGYQYLALEALSEDDEEGVNRRGYVIPESGIYVREPEFAELVREAIDLGYEVIAYDQLGANREVNAAKSLLRKISDSNEGHVVAKTLVHVGYDHINETTMLAGRIRELSGQDPLTIRQSTVLSDDQVLARADLCSAVLLSNQDETVFVEYSSNDLSVFHSMECLGHSQRGDWYFQGYRRLALSHVLAHSVCPAHIEVFRVDTNGEKAGLVDRFVITAEECSLDEFLRIPHSGFLVYVFDENGERISELHEQNLASVLQ